MEADINKEITMKQYLLIYYMLLSVITGVFSFMSYFVFQSITNVINFKVLGVLFFISFIGHMISFYREVR